MIIACVVSGVWSAECGRVMFEADARASKMSISEHKHMPEPVRRIEMFTGAGRRRSWSAVEKAAIIAESYGSGETVCAVARRHGLIPQQLFAGRRLARRSALLPPPMFYSDPDRSRRGGGRDTIDRRQGSGTVRNFVRG